MSGWRCLFIDCSGALFSDIYWYEQNWARYRISSVSMLKASKHMVNTNLLRTQAGRPSFTIKFCVFLFSTQSLGCKNGHSKVCLPHLKFNFKSSVINVPAEKKYIINPFDKYWLLKRAVNCFIRLIRSGCKPGLFRIVNLEFLKHS